MLSLLHVQKLHIFECLIIGLTTARRNVSLRLFTRRYIFQLYVQARAMQWLSQPSRMSHTNYHHVMRKDANDAAKNSSTTMKVGGMRPRGRPRLRWMDRVRSDLREHRIDPKFAQDRDTWRQAIIISIPVWYKIDKGDQSRANNKERIH